MRRRLLIVALIGSFALLSTGCHRLFFGGHGHGHHHHGHHHHSSHCH